jgi:NAD(P)-dependent dehydrogenase (short-subunit alcohol dehydrogenase family)
MGWDIRGKRALITGATSGIGEVTARELLRRGAQVVMTTRSRAKGEAVAAALRAQVPGAQLELLEGDLSSMREVKRVAEECARRFDRLELLINNAGAVFAQREVTAEGLERTLATNHLSYFLLTRELLPLLKASAPARVVNVASNAHQRGRITFDDLQREKGYLGYGVYAQSKLANILFTRELARRLAGSGVTATCLHPGVVATGFGMNRPGLLKLALTLVRPFFISPEEGAKTTLYLATSPEVEGESGGYYAHSKRATPSAAAQDDAAAARLWDQTEALVDRVLAG